MPVMETEKHFQIPDDALEDNDGPAAETYRLSAAYKANVRAQRARMQEEEQTAQARPERKQYAHEGHPKFRIFYRGMSSDERTNFMHLESEEKERRFVDWLDRRKSA